MILHLQNYIFQLFIQWLIFYFMFSSLAEDIQKLIKYLPLRLQLLTIIDFNRRSIAFIWLIVDFDRLLCFFL